MWTPDGSLSGLMFQAWLFINSVKCDKDSFGEYAADALQDSCFFFLAFCSGLNLKRKNNYEEHLKHPFVVFEASFFAYTYCSGAFFHLRSQLKGQKVGS